jgi:hypothetical protein
LILDPKRMSHGLFHPIAVVLQGDSMSVSKKTIGYIVQLGGIGAFAAGAVASVHHVAIAAAFIGGAAAFYVGQKIRSLA